MRNLSFKVLLVFVLASFNFRYLRLYPPLREINILVYGAILVLLAAAIFFAIFFDYLRIKVYFYSFLFFISGLFTWLFVVLKYNFVSEIPFFIEAVAFVPLIFVLKRYHRLKELIDAVLIYHTIISGILILAEFYLTNFMDMHFLSQHTLWALTRDASDQAPVSWGYSENYLFFGKLARPWGFMALPQSTGVYYAAVSIYFTQKLITNKKLKGKLAYLAYTFSIFSLFFSGSKTGYLLFLLFLVIILAHLARKSIFRLFTLGIFSLIFGLFVLIWLFQTIQGGMGQKGASGWSQNYNFLLMNFSNFNLEWIFGDGSNHVNAEIIRTDWSIYNIIIGYGLFTSILFLLFLVSFLFLLKKYFKNMFMEYKYLMAILLLGTFHYDSLTRFPLNIFFILIVSFFLRMYDKKLYSTN